MNDSRTSGLARRSVVRALAFACFAGVLSTVGVGAATYTAASVAYADVLAAYNLTAPAGDTVLLPAGTATWSSGLSITKGVSIIGAGTNLTVINNSVGSVFHISNTGANFVRLSNFRLNNADGQLAIIPITGPVTKFRTDHILSIRGDAFVAPNLYTAGNGPVYGVIDHCEFQQMVRPLFASDWRNGDGNNMAGRQAWSEWNASGGASFIGTDRAIYMEDCVGIWTAGTPANTQGMLYGGFGGKAVLRFCQMTGLQPYIDAHGDNPDYGTIFYEIYGNTFTVGSSAGFQGFQAWQRGGTWLTYSNNWVGNLLPMKMSVYWTYDVHRVTNTFIYANLRNGVLPASQLNNIVQVGDSGQTPSGFSAANIRQNVQFFLDPPSAMNGLPAGIYRNYRPYTYPHPLVQAPSVINAPPSTPSNSSPASGATGVSLTPTLSASAYSDPQSLAHTASQWVVTVGGTNVYDSGMIVAGTSKAVPSSTLTYNTTYTWKVRYQNSAGLWSSYSTATTFTTLAPSAPSTPTNTTPANGAVNVSLSPTLTASAYSDPQSSTQSASQWLVTRGGTNVIDSGAYPAATSYAVPVVLSNATAYAWQVRYKNGYDLWSGYSTATTFTTTNPPAPPPAPPPLPPPPQPTAPSTPSNVTPASGAVNVSRQPTLTGSVYSDPQASPQSASQFIVSHAGTNLYDSGLYIAATNYPLSLITLSNFTQYGWQVRYRNSFGLWTPFSTQTLFTTTNSIVPPAPQPPSTNQPPTPTLPPGTNTIIFQGTVILQGTFISK